MTEAQSPELQDQPVHPLRAKINNANDREPVQVEVPEWDTTVWLYPLSGQERHLLGYLARNSSPEDEENAFFTEAYVALSMRDENGMHLYPYEARGELADRDPVVVNRLYDIVVDISKMTDGDVEEAEGK
jgi:hypothetical protein